MRSSDSELAFGTWGSPQQSFEQDDFSRAEVEAEKQLSGSMPHYEEAITPMEKFTEYSLDYENPNAAGKPEAYERGLGYTKQNASELVRQIQSAVTSGVVKPYDVVQTRYGTKYKFRIPIKGANGKTKNVIAVYQIDRGESIPRLITNYLEAR